MPKTSGFVLFFTFFCLFETSTNSKGNDDKQSPDPIKVQLWESITTRAVEAGRSGEISKAENLLDSALETAKEIFAPNDYRLAATYTFVGRAAIQQSKYPKALSNFKLAVKAFEDGLFINQVHQDIFPNITMALDGLGSTQAALEDFDKSEETFRRLLKLRENTPGEERALLANALQSLGSVQLARGSSKDAVVTLSTALEISEAFKNPSLILTHSRILFLLGTAESGSKQFDLAEKHLRRALSIQETVLGEDHSEVDQDLYGIAKICQETQRFIEAKSLFERVLSIRERKLGKNHENTIQLIDELSALLDGMGLQAESAALRSRFE